MLILIYLLGWYIGAWITKYIDNKVSDIILNDILCMIIWPIVLLEMIYSKCSMHFTLFPGIKSKK